MKQFLGAMFILATCLSLNGCVLPPNPGLTELVQQCRNQYPISAIETLKTKKKILKHLLDLNECERVANISAVGGIGIDLIDVAYARKAVMYEKMVAGKMSANQADLEMKQIDSDLLSGAYQRAAQNSAMKPQKSTQTYCIPNYVGGAMCQSY